MTRSTLKKSLIGQLRSKGTDTPFYLDMVDKYMDMWSDLKAMRADIKKRGRMYTAMSASGNEYMKENENVKLIPAYIKQMQMMLDNMGITPETIVPEDGSSDEL